MDSEQLWAIYFAGICSLKFHPRNTILTNTSKIIEAAAVADLMLEEHHRRWPVETGEPTCPGS